MLSQDEKRYLRNISGDKIITIKPYCPVSEELFKNIAGKIKKSLPQLEILHIGSSGLKISGQGDIDIYVLADSDYFFQYEPILLNLFGKPDDRKPNSISWKFNKHGYEVELYLTDPNFESTARQLKVFNILVNNKRLLNKYETLKRTMSGKSYKKYQEIKYEFYHQILGETKKS